MRKKTGNISSKKGGEGKKTQKKKQKKQKKSKKGVNKNDL